MSRLCQEYYIDAWVCIEVNHLQWIWTNQVKLRVNYYNELQDTIETGVEEDAYKLRLQIILSSSIPDISRYMKQLYQDAMIICRHYDRPDFFVIFTSNSKWDEIISNILADFIAVNHPEIVSQVFNLKLKILIDELFNKYILEKIVINVYIIEFQKRDLSYAHILLILNQNDKIRDIDDIDDIICAEILDRNIDSNLYNIISRNMMHDSCGSVYPNSSYMIDGKCSKKYPRQFCDETIANEDDYSIYRW